MQTLVLYDNEGLIVGTRSGTPSPKVPVGIPSLWVEVPAGQRIKLEDGVNIEKSPHSITLETIAKSEVQVLREQIEELTITLGDTLLGGNL